MGVFAVSSHIYFSILLALVCLANLFLGIFVLIKAKDSDVNVVFFVLCLFLAFWTGGFALGIAPFSPLVRMIGANILFLGALPIPYVFVLFSDCFPDRRLAIAKIYRFLLLLPSLLLFILFASGNLIATSALPNNVIEVKLGPLNLIYYAHYLIYFAGGF